MKRDLYQIIWDFDNLRLELGYQFEANMLFMESNFENPLTITEEEGEDLPNLLNGILLTQRGLFNRFKRISDELTELMNDEQQSQ